MTELSRSLQPPRQSLDAISLDDEYELLCDSRRDDYIDEGLRGAGQFWDLAAHDNEQYLPIFAVVGAMLKLQSVTDAQFGRAIKVAVGELVKQYAADRIERERR